MRRKLIIGWILLIAGFLLLEVSYKIDVWIIGVIGRILWPVGLVIGMNASIALDCKKQQEKNSDANTNSSELGDE